MDFIQSAIERAREERRRLGQSELQATAPAGPATTQPDARQGIPRAEPNKPASDPADTAAARAALWDALPVFRPSTSRMGRNLIEAHRAGPEAAHFDMIRTKLLHQMRKHGWRRVAITSPGSACGKSTLAVNLALSLSRQPDLRCLLAELDLRRPGIARLLGLREESQFARVLTGQDAPEDHLRRVGRNLAIAVNNAQVPDAAEILQAVAAGQAMDAIDARYAPDVVICDMPPMLLADDTLAFIDQIDCVLLVAAAERTSMDEIERCAADLAARCNFLGVVLNKCRYLNRNDGYGY